MLKTWRKLRVCIPDFNKKDFSLCFLTKFFDQLSFIGNEFVGCFLLESHKGLIDCMNQKESSISAIESAIAELGQDISQLKFIVISNGDEDHFGRAGYFQKKYGTEIYMSEIDYKFAKALYKLHGKQSDFLVNYFLRDGEILNFDDVKIEAVFTPGHTPGCFSFLIPVTDEGRPHTIALWGGAAIIKDSNVNEYLASWKKFSRICHQNRVDGEIATHPFLDMGIKRLDIIRNITDGVPNPFVLGEEGYCYYEKMFYDYAFKNL